MKSVYLKQCGVKNILGEKRSASEKYDAVYRVELERHCVLWAIQQNLTLNSDRDCSPLDGLKTAIGEELLESTNQACRLHDKSRPRLFAEPAEIDTSWLEYPTSSAIPT